MRMLLSVFCCISLALCGCGDNKGKVDKEATVPPDPNLKPSSNMSSPNVGGGGGAPAGKKK